MDDFGSGYSSLNVLKDMPVDIMKIDRGLTIDIESSDRGKEMLSSIVRLANRLSIPTIAEGVENEIQFDFLKDIGCDSIQGFYFATPMPQDEFEKLLDGTEIPKYLKGESIPGQFSRDEKSCKTEKEKVVVVGKSDVSTTPAEFFAKSYITECFSNPDRIREIKEDDQVNYVLLTKEVFDRLVAEKA